MYIISQKPAVLSIVFKFLVMYRMIVIAVKLFISVFQDDGNKSLLAL